MNHPPTDSPIREQRLQEIFDETATQPSSEQIARMVARAEQIPAASRRRTPRGWPGVLMIPLAAAAAFVLVAGGLWWARGNDVPAVASRIGALPSMAPSVLVSAEPARDPAEGPALEEVYDDESFLPVDPLAVLDGEMDTGGLWMSELDVLHGPVGGDDEAYWEELDRLMREGG